LGQHRHELGRQVRATTMELFKRPNRTADEPLRREIIDENRAAYLLGLPKEQLREICEMSGLGHLEQGVTTVRLVFTYEELYRLCRLIVGPTS
jgi:hypothetical protein